MNGDMNETASIATGDGRHDALSTKIGPTKTGPTKTGPVGSVRAPDAKRTVVYARCRTEEGVARQVESGLEYAVWVLGVEHGAIVVMADHGGAMGFDRCRRPGLEALISRMAEFDRVVVEDIDRLYRDGAANQGLGRLLADAGCELHATTSGRVAPDAISLSGCMTTITARTCRRARRIAAKPR